MHLKILTLAASFLKICITSLRNMDKNQDTSPGILTKRHWQPQSTRQTFEILISSNIAVFRK